MKIEMDDGVLVAVLATIGFALFLCAALKGCEHVELTNQSRMTLEMIQQTNNPTKK